MSEHNDNIYLSKNLSNRIKSVYAQKSKLKLTTEQEHLLDLYYKRFIRSGANLNAEKQTRLREINKELSTKNAPKKSNLNTIILENFSFNNVNINRKFFIIISLLLQIILLIFYTKDYL